MSHTPGPWRAELYKWEESACGVGQRLAILRGPSDVDIAYIPVDEDDGEMHDNESLIAAAPELLAVCKEMAEILHSMSESGVGMAAGAAAPYLEVIRKAEGRE